jgi:large subunit ribosomal protein L15
MGTMSRVKRCRKYRGSRSHGYGNNAGHRKTGHKEGKGVATHWKKGQRTYMLKQKSLGYPSEKFGKNRVSPWMVGKNGFILPQSVRRSHHVNVINISELNALIDSWVENKIAEKSGSVYTMDLDKVDIQKVLARGSIDKKINVTVKFASASAIEEIEKVGGKVTLTFVKEEKVKAAPVKEAPAAPKEGKKKDKEVKDVKEEKKDKKEEKKEDKKKEEKVKEPKALAPEKIEESIKEEKKKDKDDKKKEQLDKKKQKEDKKKK